jgi:ribokinase
MTPAGRVTILGIFVADVVFRASRLPQIGETIIGSGTAIGPGGKGSNQSVAAARLGGAVTFITKIGEDAFGEIGRATWKEAGVTPRLIPSGGAATGAAMIYVNDGSGENAIIVVPAAAGTITVADIEREADCIRSARVFMTQLEMPIAVARRGLEIARAGGVTTVFNPAPAHALDDSIYSLCDYITPNGTEASMLTGVTVSTVDDARRAGDLLLKKGVGAALITLGEKGSLLHTETESVHLAAVDAGPVTDTTGAGDAYNGAFAVAIAAGRDRVDAARFASAAAGISVTRPGTAASMPTLAEVEALVGRAGHSVVGRISEA